MGLLIAIESQAMSFLHTNVHFSIIVSTTSLEHNSNFYFDTHLITHRNINPVHINDKLYDLF